MLNYLTSPLIFGWKLISDPDSYAVFLKFSRWQLLGFYLVSCLILAGLSSAEILFRQLPTWQGLTNQAFDEFAQHYPDDLLLSWSGTELQLSPSQNYQLNFPSFMPKQVTGLPSSVAQFIPSTITDPSTDSSIATQSALVVVTPTQLFVQNSEQQWSTLPITDLIADTKPFSLTKTQLLGKIKSEYLAESVWQQLRTGLVILSYPIVFLSTSWSLLVQWLLAYFILVLLYQQKISGKELARLCIPIVVVSTAVQSVAELIYTKPPISLFGLAFWMILFLVTRSLFFKSKL